MKKFSIIIPVYNIEKYIQIAIESILNQKYQDFELIIIDDGSTDKSGEICKQYKNDKRVKLIQKKNQGVSSARNLGLEKATGEYIIFVDGDDYLEPNTLQIIANNIENNDMIIFGYNEKFKKKIYQKNMTINETVVDNIKSIENVVNNKYGGYIFNKVFKKSIIKKYNIKFNLKIHMCEDLLFVIEFLQYAKNIKVIHDILYNYRMRKSSAVWQKNEKYFTVFDAYKHIDVILQKLHIDNTGLNYNVIINYLLLNKKEKKTAQKKYQINIQKIKNNIKKNIGTKAKIKMIIIHRIKFIYYLYMLIKISISKRYE